MTDVVPLALETRVSTLDLPTIGWITALAIDVDGTVFISTSTAIYTLSPAGRLALLAGSRSEKGHTDAEGPEARFHDPRGLCVSINGSLLVADRNNHCLRRVSLHGTVTTVAGSGKLGMADGACANAKFDEPYGIVVDLRDGQGTVYVTDYNNHCIRAVSDGAVSTLCGSLQGEEGWADGEGAEARFRHPTGMALDMDGNLIVADSGNHCIRKVMLDGSSACVSTVAGSRGGGVAGNGFADGGEGSLFNEPQAVVVDGQNNILVADRLNHRVRMITNERTCVTLAGSSEQDKVDGNGASARFGLPWRLAIDQRGRLLVADALNTDCLRVVEAALSPPLRLAVQPTIGNLSALQEDLGKLLGDTALADVTFTVDGQRFHAHRCVLVVRSPYFKALIESGLQEEASRAAGKDIVIKEVSAGAFRVLLRFVYTHKLPEMEDCGEGLEAGEMAGAADRFQALELYERCVQLFREGLEVSNVMERLVLAHDSQLPALENTALAFVMSHRQAIQVRVLESERRCYCVRLSIH